MPDGNDIGAKIVLSGDATGAVAAVTQTTDSVKGLRDESGRFVASGGAVGDKLKEIGEHASSASGAGVGKLKGSLVELAGQFPGASGAISAFGEVAEAVETGPLAGLAVGIGVVASGIEVAKKGIEEFSKIEVSDTKLDQALSQAGQLTDDYREKLQRLGKEMQETSGIAEERWVAVLARLEQFGADRTNINEYAEAVKNLAGLLGGNIERAGMIFSRAMNGNTGVLGRLGIQVDKTASSHEKLESIMAQLAQRGGGQLEAQTRTISGEFTRLENATADLFKGIGNLISRTGALQGVLNLAGRALNFFAGLFPDTVEKVEGLINKLPPLKDELGHVKGAADDAGEGMDDMGESAQGAVGGLERAGEAASKAKDKFEEAADAAKKLREQQDQLADAKTALALANVTAAEDRGAISKADADKRRAEIRAGAEKAKLDREGQEQNEIIHQQRLKQGEAHTGAANAADARQQAEAEYRGVFGNDEAAQALRDDADEAAKKGQDFYGEQQKIQQDKAKAAREAAANEDSIKNDPRTSGYYDPKRAAALTEEAKSSDAMAARLGKSRELYVALRQAREDETAAAKKEADVMTETNKVLADAYAAKDVVGVKQQTAAVNASNEQTKLANDAEKKRLEEEQKLLEHSLKNDALPDATATAEQEKFRANQLRLNALQYGGDGRGLAIANATAPLPPGAEANVKLREQIIKEIDDSLKLVPNLTPEQKERLTRARDAQENAVAAEKGRGDDPNVFRATEFNRQREQGQHDDEETGGGAGVAGLARALGGDVAAGGTAVPGTVSGAAQSQVQALIAKLLQSGGTDRGSLPELLRALHAYVDARAANGDRNPKLEADIQRLTVKLDQLANQVKNQR